MNCTPLPDKGPKSIETLENLCENSVDGGRYELPDRSLRLVIDRTYTVKQDMHGQKFLDIEWAPGFAVALAQPIRPHQPAAASSSSSSSTTDGEWQKLKKFA